MATDAEGKALPPDADAFVDALLNKATVLAAAVEWIADHMNPADVFPDEALEEWARQRGYEKATD